MSRIYSRTHGAVEVKVNGGDPEQFIWRDRLYRVSHVLQQWDRSAAWWKDVGSASAGHDLRTWRVEASTGRCAPRGVYELCFDPGAGQWYLARTFD